MPESPYRERILDHYRLPRHRGHLEAPDLVGEADNPICGDRVRIELRLDGQGNVAEAAFTGDGCVISMAAASMLMEHLCGRSLAEIQRLTDRDILDLLGVELGPARIPCARLSLEALHQALEGYRTGGGGL